ncbi:PREDICTED: tryptase beta-2-like [Nicrophorus vespilloides]|uniref:Tryptase beta-2-like n=1 Tax=Nicrophorus vespilloides TaxID=110193 RepID=A0ABM1MWW3_NICVS|nr:PREDICTED: tryptase beta-2-like [Nicrophorus vespilloides]
MWFLTILVLSLPKVQSSGNNSSSCVCMPQQLCSAFHRNGLVDIRFDQGTCTNHYEVCCEKPESLKTRKCGLQKGAMGYRITGSGNVPYFGELPWSTVLFEKKDTERIVYKCGGSLIHHRAVITAAHCVDSVTDGQQWTIRVGEWNMKSRDELLPHQDRSVSEIVIHEHYRRSSLRNDIALLILDHPVEITENVGFICLPPPAAPPLTTNDVRCIASGWGTDAFQMGKHSSILKKVELPIVPRDVCLRSLRSTRLGKLYHLHRSFICAGGEHNQDACTGDGGSPLVCPIPGQPGRFQQVGIVSWGIGCGANNTPGVYTNVALYGDWVDTHLASRSFDTSLYKYH